MTHDQTTPASVEVTLKPCPFCGSSDVCVQGGEYVCCGQCLADGPYFADDMDRTPEAIAAWNTRHSAPVGEVELVEALRALRNRADDVADSVNTSLMEEAIAAADIVLAKHGGA